MSQLVLPHTIDAGTEITAVEHQSNYTAIRDLINGNLEGGGGVNGNIKQDGITAREITDLVHNAHGKHPLQEGLIGAGDGKVTPGAGLVLNYAAGAAWIADDAGLIASNVLIPAFWTASTVTIAANASGNPRIDRIVATLTGYDTATVSVVQGTPTVGATLDNFNGIAAMPSGAVQLANILVPNGFGGPFVQTTHIRDRRPWARGAFTWMSGSANGTDYTTTSGTAVQMDATNLVRRLELGANPVLIDVSLQAWATNLDTEIQFTMRQNATEIFPARRFAVPVATDSIPIHMQTIFLPGAAGSYNLDLTFHRSAGTGTATVSNSFFLYPQVVFREVLLGNANNAGA